MSITNLYKSYKTRWETWTTPWSSNNVLTWAQLSGEATTNPTKVVQYETWDTLTSTWDTETRTWDQMSTTWSNTSKPSTSITNTSKP